MFRFGEFLPQSKEMFVCPGGVLPALSGPISRHLDHQRTSDKFGFGPWAEGRAPCAVGERRGQQADSCWA